MFNSLWPHGPQHARPPCPSLTPSLLKLMSIESVMPSNHLILCRPILFLPSIFPSIRGFSNESVLRISWPKYWSFSFSISPSSEYSGCTAVSWLPLLCLCIPSLPWLATAWKASVPRSPTGSCLVSFSAHFWNPNVLVSFEMLFKSVFEKLYTLIFLSREERTSDFLSWA